LCTDEVREGYKAPLPVQVKGDMANRIDRSLVVILLGGGDPGDVIAVASAITVGNRQIFLEVLPNA